MPGHARHGDVHRRHIRVGGVPIGRRAAPREAARVVRLGLGGRDVGAGLVLPDRRRVRPTVPAVNRPRRERNHLGRADPLALTGLVRVARGRGHGGARALGRRAGHVAGPKTSHLACAALEVAAARVGRQVVGVGDPQNDARLGRGEGAQADPVGQMGFQTVEAALLQTLGGQQKVDLHRAPQASDGDEQLNEIRLGRQQLGELIEDDEQGRQRLPVMPARAARLLVVGDVGVVARVAEHLLAARHLPAQGLLHAIDQPQLALQVGDHGGHVRELRHPREGGAALEVHQHEVELIGRVGQRQRQHEGAQDLGLARAGRAHEQPVGAHAALGGLLDVQNHRGALRRDGEGDPQAVPPRPPAAPDDVRVDVAHVPEFEKIEEIGRALEVGGAHRSADGGLPGGAEARGQASDDGLGGCDVHQVGYGGGGVLPGAHDLHGSGVGQRGGRVQQEAESRQRGQRAPPLGQVDDGRPVHPAARGDGSPGGHQAAVNHDDDVRHGSVGDVVGEGPAILEILGQQLERLLPRRRDHTGGAGIILNRVRPDVGRPFEPFPLPQILLGGHHRHAQLAGRRHGQQMREQSACQRASGIGLTNDFHAGEVIQRGPQRQTVDVAVGDHESRHGGQAHGVGLGQRVELLRDQLHAQRLGRTPQPHEHLVVAGSALPHPSAVLDEIG